MTCTTCTVADKATRERARRTSVHGQLHLHCRRTTASARLGRIRRATARDRVHQRKMGRISTMEMHAGASAAGGIGLRRIHTVNRFAGKRFEKTEDALGAE